MLASIPAAIASFFEIFFCKDHQSLFIEVIIKSFFHVRELTNFLISIFEGLVKKTILTYGLVLAIGILLYQYLQYKLIVKDLGTELFVGVIGLIFLIVGIWMGISWGKNKLPASLKSNTALAEKMGISTRELEVWKLIVEGKTNKEIADGLFVSVNTIKTHVSNLYSKLDVQRRTQAVQKARELKMFTHTIE
jgi:NarL family two-component system response regulator LiaR